MSPLLPAALLLGATPTRVGLLICDDPGACESDRQWVAGMGGAGPEGFDLLDFGDLVATRRLADGADQLTVLTDALATARRAAADKKWGEAADAADRGLAALAVWRGTMANDDLFALWFIAGASRVGRSKDQSWAYDLRQAAAIANGADMRLPTDEPAVTRAWLDEQRKLLVGGRGTLAFEGAPEGTTWFVDGRPVGAGPASVLAGNHRVSAQAPGRLRTWSAAVPVLPERTSKVAPDFAPTDEANWVLARVNAAFSTLDAPEGVKDLLVTYAAHAHADELRLLRVDTDRRTPVVPTVAISAAPAERPAAAAGEPVDMGDGIPLTYEAEVRARADEVGEGHVVESNRLRVVFFDPATRRFSMDSRVSTALEPGVERVRLGVRTGYLVAMERHHLGVDLSVALPTGPVWTEARLGLVRADAPYNLYDTWVDRQLYHVYAGARWAPSWTIAPYAAAGAELYIPAAYGARLELGGTATFAGAWHVDLAGDVGVLDQGVELAAGLGLARGF